jgi:hypothetical protein
MNSCLNCNKPAKNKYCSISCLNINQGAIRANKKYGEVKSFLVECNKCKCSFESKEREKLFPQKEFYYCSRSCANTRVHSDETKLKLVKILNIVRPLNITKDDNRICKNCSKNFYVKPSKEGVFCSKSCTSTWNNINLGIGRKAGLASVSIQSKNRRSKNETYFAELCKERFNEVKFNEPMFNGWDADVIIEDLKLAVLWNGKWHYEKITEKHSVEQVQNRDKIKLKEIAEKGYGSYVIKDMGKYKKTFVEEKFKEMLVFLKL